MKVLYISENLISPSGGVVGNKRNQKVLKEYFGQKSVFYKFLDYKAMNICRKYFFEIKNRNIFGVDKEIVNEIFADIKSYNIDLVWLDSSNLGFLAEKIKLKYPKLKIITFFHNVEYSFMIDQLKLTYNPKFFHRIALAWINEKKACKYSDRIICYNDRDASGIFKRYGRYPDMQIPISLKDDDISSDIKLPLSNCTALFLGSNFPPNIEGIRWFVKNVLPFTKINLVIAGSGMEFLRDEFCGIDRLQVLGYVEDLNKLYASVRFMVMPILSGSGMKVKTAEALKYGKFIFASPEAVVGYKVTKTEVCVCEDAKAYIKNINNMSAQIDGFNKSSRDLYKKYYSYAATRAQFNVLFSKL